MRKLSSRLIMITMLVLLGVQEGRTQTSERAKEKTTIEVPKAIQAEHEELLGALARLTEAGGFTGTAAKNVAKLLEPHFAKENAYALPPLGLLVPLSRGDFDCGMTEVLKMTDRLEAEMPAMLSEHREIAGALKALREAASAENKPAGVEFADHLAAHARTEEELSYPAALLVGRYLKTQASRCPG